VSGAVEQGPLATPPSSPAIGAAYIVAGDATGAWAGKANCIASWTSGGWTFIAPAEGMNLYERTSGTWAIFREGGWSIGTVPATALLIEGQQGVGRRA